MRRLFLGLTVVSIAISSTAFKDSNRAVGDYLVQYTNGVYQQVSEEDFDQSYCVNISFQICAYKQINSQLIGTLPLNQGEINANLTANPARIEAVSEGGIYTD